MKMARAKSRKGPVESKKASSPQQRALSRVRRKHAYYIKNKQKLMDLKEESLVGSNANKSSDFSAASTSRARRAPQAGPSWTNDEPMDVDEPVDSENVHIDDPDMLRLRNVGPSMSASLNDLRAVSDLCVYAACDRQFIKTFVDNEFGVSCAVCDRLWFTRDLKPLTQRQLGVMIGCMPELAVESRVCRSCYTSLTTKKVPTMCVANGFKYPEEPQDLPTLTPVEERLISPRLLFMQIRRLRYEGNYGIVGQIINVPVDANNMLLTLPRQLDDDYAINVNIKKKLIHKSIYLSGHVRKGVIKKWLLYLAERPLYNIISR